MSDLLSRKHALVRKTLIHHGITGFVHTALIADVIHGLEAMDAALAAAQPVERKPLDTQSIDAAAREQFDGDAAEEHGFRCGAQWAEREHGIAQQGDKT